MAVILLFRLSSHQPRMLLDPAHTHFNACDVVLYDLLPFEQFSQHHGMLFLNFHDVGKRVDDLNKGVVGGVLPFFRAIHTVLDAVQALVYLFEAFAHFTAHFLKSSARFGAHLL